MSLPLFFVENPHEMSELARALEAGNEARLVELRFGREEMKHVAALRLRAGERFVAADGVSRGFEVELAQEPDKAAGLCVVRPVAPARLPRRANVTLVQGVSKGERMDLLVRQAVELGVPRIVPALTARCIVRLDGDKRVARAERWRGIALAAAKQSGQPLVPHIEVPVGFDEAVAMAAAEADVIVCPWEECDDGASIAGALRGMPASTRVFVFIGPEGGLERTEVEALRAVGAHVVTLGDTILRTETAGVIASALAIYELGGLGNGGVGGEDAPHAPIAGFADGVPGSDPSVRDGR